MAVTNSEVQDWILNIASESDLNMIQELIRTKQRIQFDVGDRVWFDAKTRGIIHGKVVKMNAKSAKVVSDSGMRWTVDPGLLHSVSTKDQNNKTGV